MLTQDQTEVRHTEEAQELIRMAENLYAKDFEPTRFNKSLPAFTEAQARAFLNERQAYLRRWTNPSPNESYGNL